MDQDLRFDLDEIPFSMRGSWLSVSRVVGLHTRMPDVHLVSHRTGMHPILRIEPLRDGAAVRTLPEATPGRLRWSGPDGVVEIAFADPDRLRIRGRGMSLRLSAAAARLTSFSGSYLYRSPTDGSFVLTSYESGRRYQIAVRAGEVRSDGVERLGGGDRSLLVHGASESAEWELEMRETASVGAVPADPRTFDEIVAQRRVEFAGFADAVVPWRATDPTAGLAAYVLWSAVVAPEGFVARDAVLMSKHWMDKVWSWDHCFNAIALARSHPDLAMDQFLIVFDHQTIDGALPDSVTHSEVLYNFVKPPIHGWAFAEIRRRLREPVPDDTLREVYRSLSAWSRFWLDHRRAPGSALPFYEHGNDSGWDNSTVFDLDRVVESPDLAAFLIVQLTVLADLAREVAPAEETTWREEALTVTEAMRRHLWDGERMVARAAVTHRTAASSSLLPALALLAGDALPQGAVEHLVTTMRAHLTDFGLATELVDSDAYEPDGYWRGPIWAPSTVLAADALRRVGETDLADEVTRRFVALCARSGFAENFDALTGEGLRDRAYTWTASAYVMLTTPPDAA